MLSYLPQGAPTAPGDAVSWQVPLSWPQLSVSIGIANDRKRWGGGFRRSLRVPVETTHVGIYQERGWNNLYLYLQVNKQYTMYLFTPAVWSLWKCLLGTLSTLTLHLTGPGPCTLGGKTLSPPTTKTHKVPLHSRILVSRHVYLNSCSLQLNHICNHT